MKATGIVRRVDELGRIVLPMELRRTMHIADGDSLEIYVDEESIILTPYKRGCVFCGEADDYTEVLGKLVCGGCRAAIAITEE